MKKWSMILALSLCAALLFSGCGHKKPENGYVLKTDLAGAAIGIVQGITTEQQVQDNIKNAKVKTYNSIEEATQALAAREVNVLALDAKNAKNLINSDTRFGQMLEKLTDKAYRAVTHMVGTDANDDFTLEIGSAISRIQASGEYDTMYAHYFSGSTPSGFSGAYTPSAGKVAGRELVVGIAEDSAPFCYRAENGDLIGLDVEFANEVAKTWGAKLTVRTYPREKLLTALANDEIKMALGRFTEFDDQRDDDDIFFSLPYYDASQVLICNAEDVGENPLKQSLAQ